MKNWKRYLYGFILGMIVEYLFRVEFSIFPLIVIVAISSMLLIDLMNTKEI